MPVGMVEHIPQEVIKWCSLYGQRSKRNQAAT